MAESPDGRGVILFGGHSTEHYFEKRILELQARADAWKILDVSLEVASLDHVVIPLS